jgi:hypothetical protein
MRQCLPADLLETVRRVVTPRVVRPGTASTSIQNETLESAKDYGNSIKELTHFVTKAKLDHKEYEYNQRIRSTKKIISFLSKTLFTVDGTNMEVLIN